MSLEELWELFPIILEEHSTVYKEWYAIEEKALLAVINPRWMKRLNHIGSTAVEGLIAKPTVDILLEIDEACDLLCLIEKLKVLGWNQMSDQRQPFLRMSFNKGYTQEGFSDKVYHLHVQYYGDWDELYFRDYLKEHPDVAKEYGDLKINLLKPYEHNRDGYTAAKTDFVKKYSALARDSYQDRYLPK
jgi:GrpB-like predicted nucleotidyltransferase (UPF0157 family)